MSVVLAVLAVVVSLAGALPDADGPDLRVHVVDRDASQLHVAVHGAGLLSFLGHEHAIVPGAWEAELCLADPIPAGASARVTIHTASLVIDSDSARALAGMGGGPGAEAREEIQQKMLDSAHLDAAGFPEIDLDLHAARPADGRRVTVGGTITLHGATRSVDFPVDVADGDDGTLILSGTLRIRQRDFGIEPESRAGLVKVSNDVDLHFSMVARATEQTCAARATG